MGTFMLNQTSLSSFFYQNTTSNNLSFGEDSVRKPESKDICITILLLYLKKITKTPYTVSEYEHFLPICRTINIVRAVAFFSSMIIGIPGNILALLIILQFPRTTGTFYMEILSASDLVALIIKAIGITMNSLQLHSTTSCKLITTFADVTATYANWVLVLICFERFVTIQFPLKKNYYFTLRRAHLSVIVLAIVIFLFNVVYLFNETFNKGCTPIDEDLDIIWSHVSTTLYSYLPSVLLIVLVLLIWRALKNIQRSRIDVFCGTDQASVNYLTQQRLQEQTRMERSITIMLLFASITFILLTLPLCIVIAVDNSGVEGHSDWNIINLELVRAIATGLVTLSHAINFFVYFISAGRFRSHLMKLLKCSRFSGKQCLKDRTEMTTVDQL